MTVLETWIKALRTKEEPLGAAVELLSCICQHRDINGRNPFRSLPPKWP